MSESARKFFETVTQNADGTQTIAYVNTKTGTGRSNVIFAPANSTLCIHMSAAASVTIKNNPFGDATKDFTIKTVTATTQEVVTSAMQLVLDVTANSGTITVELILNED